ncbi:hypothetical protein ACJX0J_040275 [Zea mays]
MHTKNQCFCGFICFLIIGYYLRYYKKIRPTLHLDNNGGFTAQRFLNVSFLYMLVKFSHLGKIYGIALAIFISSCLIIALYAQMNDRSVVIKKWGAPNKRPYHISHNLDYQIQMVIFPQYYFASSKSTIYGYGWLLVFAFSF